MINTFKIFFKSKPKVIWCDLLSLKILLFCIIIKILRCEIILKYTQATPIAENFIVWLQRKNLFGWIKEHPFMFGIKTKNGDGIWNETDHLCNKIVDCILDEEYELNDYLPDWAKCDPYYSFRLKSALRATISSRLWHPISVIVMANHNYKLESKMCDNYRTPIFILRATSESYFLKNIMHDKNIIFILGFMTRGWELTKLIIRGMCFGNPKRLKTLFTSSPVCNQEAFSNKQGKILVEYNTGNFTGDRSHLFWFDDKKIDPQRVIVYFDRGDSPASKENITIVEKEKMGWLNLRGLRCLSNPFIVWGKCLRGVTEIPRPTKLEFFQIWRWLSLFKINCEIVFWRDIYKQYKIKIIIQHQEGSPQQYSQLLAINLEGGIMLGFIWSNPLNYRKSNEFYPQDIYFVWGKMSRDWIIYGGNRPKWLLISGFIWDRVKEKYKDEGLLLRKKFSKKVQFIMALFDTGGGPKTKREFIIFYNLLLNYAMNHSNWGVFIKPKGLWEWGSIDKTISTLMQQLAQDKRLIISDNLKNPMIATNVADICIGMFINSAAVVAAINGSLSVCWDATGCRHHPLHKFQNSILIYPGLEQIISILDNFSLKQKYSLIGGNQNSLLDNIDPFRDGKAYNRVGNFIQTFLGSLDGGFNKEEALTKTVYQYKKDNGEKTAINLFDNYSNTINEDNMWYGSSV